MISYAQNFEDVLLNRVFRGRADGFYVDVGASDPVHISVTKWFYDLGWSGINIEPHTEFFRKLGAERPRDVNLNCGAGSTRTQSPFFELPSGELSSFDPRVRDRARAQGETVREHMVPVVPLNDILAQHVNGRAIDFLKIDVEGWEREVLTGLDLRRYRPTVVVIEATNPLTQDASFAAWEDVFLDAQYQPVHFDGLNRFYLPAERIELKKHFALPPNVFDDFILWQTRELSNHLAKARSDLVQAKAERKWLPGFLVEAWDRLLGGKP